MTESKASDFRTVSIRLDPDLFKRVKSKLAMDETDWQNLISTFMERYVSSDESAPRKERADPLNKEALAIREWLTLAALQPKGTWHQLQAEMIRKAIKLPVPEPVGAAKSQTPATPARETERPRRRDVLRPTEEPA